MVFTIDIDGKPVEFSNALAWQFKYKSQFKEDPTDFIIDAIAVTSQFEGKTEEEERAAYLAAVKVIKFGRLANLAWAMAKTANKDIPAPPIWQSSFKAFPVLEIGIECLAYAIEGITGESEPKNADAPEDSETPASV
jgi:hypothetical protein